MIPVRLRMQDFLSYKDADLDFSGLDVVCLTGANGQGKSALLDAITWALFGAARGCEGGQNQDRVIRDGGERATVDLTFELSGQPWRVVRSRTRTGRADLQLQVAGPDGSWTAAAGESLRETEARIGELLRMDYKTFTASAFLLQGRADDFLSRMKPEERKDVFARLLDLGTYERLEAEARSRAREAEAVRKTHVAEIERLLGSEGERDEVASCLDQAVRRLERAGADLAAAAEELEARAADVARLQAALDAVEREQAELKSLEARLEAGRRSVEAKRTELGELDTVIAQSEAVTAALAELEAAVQSEAAMREAADTVGALESERADLAARAEAAREDARRRLDETSRRADELRAETAGLGEREEQLGKLESLLHESADVDDALAEVRGVLAALRDEHASIRAELAALAEKDSTLQERLEAVSGAEGACPVCEGPLTKAHRVSLTKSIRAEVKEVSVARQAREGRQKDVEKEGQRLAEEEKRLVAVVDQRQRLLREAAGLRASVERLPELRDQLAVLLSSLADLQTAVDGDAAAAEWSGRIAVVEEAIATAGYDRASHDRLRERIEHLSGARATAARIEDATRTRVRVEAELAETQEQVARDEAERADRAAGLEALCVALSGADDVRARAESARQAVDALRSDERAAEAERARLAERLQRLDEDVTALQAARASERQAGERQRTYARLSQAFGRGGIPDLIVENALPELTSEANELLGKLSDYDMSVQFVMDKPTKSGKARETFEVLVHHDGGVRDFQMFSGGEAFRVAFAIRLALSKLLVRRAGARLETLVIDEGFGTQDVEGRERLVEAINVARQEFAKVLVITHLDELKDAFGAQIAVSKDPVDGSRARIVGAPGGV